MKTIKHSGLVGVLVSPWNQEGREKDECDGFLPFFPTHIQDFGAW